MRFLRSIGRWLCGWRRVEAVASVFCQGDYRIPGDLALRGVKQSAPYVDSIGNAAIYYSIFNHKHVLIDHVFKVEETRWESLEVASHDGTHLWTDLYVRQLRIYGYRTIAILHATHSIIKPVNPGCVPLAIDEKIERMKLGKTA